MDKVTTRLTNGYRTEIQTRNQTWHTDEPADKGGEDTAPTPTEMLAGALGACIAVTCKMYANRKDWDLQNVAVDIEIERFNGTDYAAYDGDERYIHEIREKIVFEGDLDEKQIARLLDVADRCPVSRVIATPTFYVRELVETLP